MKKHDDYPWLDNMLSEHLKRTSIPFDFDHWARAHPQQAQALQDKGKHSIKSTTMPLWRRIMKSPYTKIAAVIGIGVTVFSFLFPYKHGVIPESVALADVQAAVQAQETIFAAGTRTLTFVKMPHQIPPGWESLFHKPEAEDGPVTFTLYSETYISPLGYANKVFDERENLVAYGSIHNESGICTFLIPAMKAYLQFELSEAYREAISWFTIQGFIDMLYQSDDSRELDPKHIQGIEAVGFEVTDWQERIFIKFPQMARFIVNPGKTTARVWIDPLTKLPVLSECECELNSGLTTFFENAHLDIIDDTFEWGLDIEESLFLPAIPEDYHKLVIPSATQAGLVATSAVVLAMTPLTVFFIRRRRRKAKK